MMHNHRGAHILLEDDWSQYGEVKPAFPCGLCGIRSAIMCKSAIAAIFACMQRIGAGPGSGPGSESTETLDGFGRNAAHVDTMYGGP
jgi:hypothetical protein